MNRWIVITLASILVTGCFKKSVEEPKTLVVSPDQSTFATLEEPKAVEEQQVDEVEVVAPKQVNAHRPNVTAKKQAVTPVKPQAKAETKKVVETVAQVPNQGSSESTVASSRLAGEVEPRFVFEVLHQAPPVGSTRPFSQLYFEPSFQLSVNHRIGAAQEAKKLYEIEPKGESELLVGDTVLFHEYRFYQGNNTQVKSQVGVTLPVSLTSQREQHLTRPSLGFVYEKSFASNRVKLSLQPYVEYFWNQYTTSPTGSPLRKWGLNQVVRLDWSIGRRFQWSAYLKGSYTTVENNPKTGSASDPISDLDWGSYVGVGLLESTQFQLGVAKSNGYINQPLVQSDYYDAVAARLFAGLQITF